MGKTLDPIIRFNTRWKLSTEHFYNEEPCWEWAAPLTHKGYGELSVNGKQVLVHRWSYEYHREPIPTNLQIDHLCRVRHCVNPAHLEVVTSQENTRRGLDAITRANRIKRKPKTHCIQGHPFNEENTLINSRGWRACRLCDRNWRRRKRAGVLAQPKTHCRNGHLLNDIRIETRYNGRIIRVCRECKRVTGRRNYRDSRKLQAAKGAR